MEIACRVTKYSCWFLWQSIMEKSSFASFPLCPLQFYTVFLSLLATQNTQTLIERLISLFDDADTFDGISWLTNRFLL